MIDWSLRRRVLVTLLLSLISLATQLFSIWTLGEVRHRVMATIAVISLLAALAMAIFAIVVHRRRGLWVALSALPALLLPVFSVTFGALCTTDESCD
jgi:hypothetical protein